jgi:hypothetical protein
MVVFVIRPRKFLVGGLLSGIPFFDIFTSSDDRRTRCYTQARKAGNYHSY